MPELNGDGINRIFAYAHFRDDKEPTPGHSHELVNNLTDPAWYDKMEEIPLQNEECNTLLKHFKRHVAQTPDKAFLGTRTPPTTEGGEFGPYQWITYKEVDHATEMLARGMRHYNLAPQIEGEGKMQRICGIWAKNNKEWMITQLACMKVRTSVVGFYDAMGSSAVDFIIEQTELKTIVCTQEYLARVIEMKKEGLARHVETVISMDGGVEAMKNEALLQEIQLLDLSELIVQMEDV